MECLDERRIGHISEEQIGIGIWLWPSLENMALQGVFLMKETKR